MYRTLRPVCDLSIPYLFFDFHAQQPWQALIHRAHLSLELSRN